nr:MAG TPA: hypothetical protein [Caudoviricetes sp.]
MYCHKHSRRRPPRTPPSAAFCGRPTAPVQSRKPRKGVQIHIDRFLCQVAGGEWDTPPRG